MGTVTFFRKENISEFMRGRVISATGIVNFFDVCTQHQLITLAGDEFQRFSITSEILEQSEAIIALGRSDVHAHIAFNHVFTKVLNNPNFYDSVEIGKNAEVLSFMLNTRDCSELDSFRLEHAQSEFFYLLEIIQQLDLVNKSFLNCSMADGLITFVYFN